MMPYLINSVFLTWKSCWPYCCTSHTSLRYMDTDILAYCCSYLHCHLTKFPSMASVSYDNDNTTEVVISMLILNRTVLGSDTSTFMISHHVCVRAPNMKNS